jgi:hypothetical protein
VRSLPDYFAGTATKLSRQTGSHLRLTSTSKGTEHHVTIPAHKESKLDTLGSILSDVAEYLKKDREDLAKELFD